MYLLFLFTLVSAVPDWFMIPEYIDDFSDDMIDYINSISTTWEAGRNFIGIDPEYIQGLMGARQESPMYALIGHSVYVPSNLPESFDSRQKWYYCPSIRRIRDQGSCGSCWAVAAAGAMSDRHCIHSGGRVQVELSSEDILTCCGFACGTGCRGGFASGAWNYWIQKGVVTGGPYESRQGCKTYSFWPCEHHMTGERPPCTRIGETPPCVPTCREGYNTSYQNDKYFGKSFNFLPNDELQIRAEIYQNGPVEATYTVYTDFVHYKKGVYQQYSKKKMGMHSARIIGWGTENGVPYWLISNTWNTDWGDGGNFKILRGTNECGIEDSVIAGMPATPWWML